MLPVLSFSFLNEMSASREPTLSRNVLKTSQSGRGGSCLCTIITSFTLCGFELKEDAAAERWMDVKEIEEWGICRRRRLWSDEERRQVKDGEVSQDSSVCQGGVRTGGDGCEGEAETVCERWELPASSSVCLSRLRQARWRIQSSSAGCRLRRVTLSQPIDLSPCWKYEVQRAIWEVTNLHFLSSESPAAL